MSWNSKFGCVWTSNSEQRQRLEGMVKEMLNFKATRSFLGSRLILQEQTFQDKDLWIRTKQATKSGATNGALGDPQNWLSCFSG